MHNLHDATRKSGRVTWIGHTMVNGNHPPFQRRRSSCILSSSINSTNHEPSERKLQKDSKTIISKNGFPLSFTDNPQHPLTWASQLRTLNSRIFPLSDSWFQRIRQNGLYLVPRDSNPTSEYHNCFSLSLSPPSTPVLSIWHNTGGEREHCVPVDPSLHFTLLFFH